MHGEWAIKAAEAGKHMIVEKPIGINYAEAAAMIEAARDHDVFLMEAFMYRCHPQIARLVELLNEHAIGDVRVVNATFSFQSGFNPEARLFKNALGGGGILDVGCYAMSMARLVAGAAQGAESAEPLEVKGTARVGATGVDEWAVASLKFPGDIIAQVATGVLLNQENCVRIFGSGGSIYLPAPWGMGEKGGTTRIVITRSGKEPEELKVETTTGAYTMEADMAADNIIRRQAVWPAMTWDDTLGNMKALDRWRESIGQAYESENAEANRPVSGRALKRRPSVRMPYAKLAHLDREVSRLVMGIPGGGIPHIFALYDRYYEMGGNCFDTAFIYGNGRMDENLGAWIRNRGVRDSVVTLCKGAHTPNCNPKDLSSQLLKTLERMKTDHTDIYMMHRDNTDIPVGEFVDVLNGHVKAGRIGAFAGSNWTLKRMEEANEYARKNGLHGFSVVGNNFSLARMVEAPWTGCIASSDGESREWLRRTQLPLMPWSSQAQGFFAGLAAPDKRDNADFVRCWYADDNFERLKRATELAKKKGCIPTNIALAWVLNQPFPVFPLVGPRALHEVTTTLVALDIELTPEEMAWLNLEA